MPDSPHVINTEPNSFAEHVFARSEEVPVVLDFWAPWCPPCRALGPVLESLADEYQGQFVLVKANTEEVPEEAARFNVQSIPIVFAVVGGDVVDYFEGALPDAQIRPWLDRVIASGLLAQARTLEESDPEKAEAVYRQLLDGADDHVEARIGLARTLLQQNQIAESREEFAKLESRGFLEPEAEKFKAALDLKGLHDDRRLAEARQAATDHPDDLAAQLHFAESLAGDGQYEKALQICLSLVEKDRAGTGEKARQRMIEIFRVLPDDSELTSEYRRKLSMLLY